MKKVILLALVFLGPAFTASAQDEEIKPNQEADRQAISNLEQGFAHAIQLNNSTIFNTVFSEIRLIQTSSNSYQFVHASDIQVKIFRDVASVFSLRSERGASDGRQFNRQFRVLHVYINTPRGWRVISSQETQLPTQLNR